MPEILLQVDRLSKNYSNKIVIEDFSFPVYKGEFLSLLGSSGCGKTTLLRLLIGIEKPDSGKILKNGVDLTDKTPFERGMGIVFQNYALFPNMNVYQNIAYALKARKMPKDEIDQKVKKIVSLVGLDDHIFKKPSQLSGGQQQRVAIARTLVLDPDIILFDEPMSALDTDIKMKLRKLIKDLQKTLGITMIYVTHDQEEAFSLSDRIMVINDNKIVQLDTPSNIYHHPSCDYVKEFVVDNLDRKLHLIEDSIK
jgi:ABC-type Fe3+/spermidine/putrescine transport system ATPase subunit